MTLDPQRQRAILTRLDALPANTLVTLSMRNGNYFAGYVSGVGTDDLIDLHDAPASVMPNGKHVVIDGCDLTAFRVE